MDICHLRRRWVGYESRGGTCHKNRLHLQYSLQVRKGSRCHEDIVVCSMYKIEVHFGVAAVIYASPERPKVLNFFSAQKNNSRVINNKVR